MKEKLIKDLSVARPIYKQIENMYLKLYAIEDKKIVNYSYPILVLAGQWLVGMLITGAIIFIPYQLLDFIFRGALEGIYVLICCVIGPICFIRFKGRKRVKDCDKQIEEIQQEINAYIEANDCPELYCVPADCRNYHAVNYIYEALVSGRADTLKEAMIQYEQQLQILKLEAKLNQQIEQTERLRNDVSYLMSCIR